MVADSNPCEGSELLALACRLTPEQARNHLFYLQLVNGDVVSFQAAERRGAWIAVYGGAVKTGMFGALALQWPKAGMEFRFADVRAVSGGFTGPDEAI